MLENERLVELPKWLVPSEVLLKREPAEVEDENPCEVEELPKCELSM